ncbi:MAG: FAD:protein FMN transferase [Elusimicrobiota bacterium]
MLKKILSAFFLLGASSFVGNAAEVSRVQYLMGTLCEIHAIGETEDHVNTAITKAFLEISRLEDIFSAYRAVSEVSTVNRLASQKTQFCSFDMFSLMRESISFSEKTNGAFDVTLKNNGYQKIILNEKDQSLSFQTSDIQVDFGGIGKGYALDKATVILKQNGIQSAELNFSGNILVFNQSNLPYPVSLVDPLDPKKNVLTFYISNGSVSTSSQLERKNHIIDPRSGKPVDFKGSVTVVSPTATEADALSTALLVLGSEKGIKMIEKQFKNSSVLYLIPSEQGWIQMPSSQFPKS